MTRSLRARLFIGLTSIVILTGAIGATFAYLWAYDEAIEIQDSVLIQVGAFALGAPFKENQAVNGVDVDSEIGVVELGNAPRGPADMRRLWVLQDGLHNDSYQGQAVRVLLRTRPDGSRLAVTQSSEIRTELAGNMALRTLLPIAALVPCLMLVIAIVIARSLGPMVRLADELDGRRADDMRLLATEGAPSELQPFLASINGLLARVYAMVDQQRHFIADAAHELRTPITALSLQAENLDSVDMSVAARERVNALKRGMRRTRQLLEQLLVLARQQSGLSDKTERVFLDRVAKGVVADLWEDAAVKDVELGFTVADEVEVDGNSFALTSAIRNVVENAIKFSPDGGTVDLGVTREGAMAVVQIEDSGPGIPPADIDRIFEPFFRGSQPSGEGSGLGLSIARRAIDQAGGVIEIENIIGRDRSGLRVTIKLQAARVEASQARAACNESLP
ncbi:Periplasmic sensor signal transduction histidine kinase precursor [Bradyrhizobium sp. STM 3843]|uniref:sensor histidine kinase n=1 Tax=Bradyrhizobium sp. STM 3843 TaxID=551947 RepID=UPI0002404C75|nr:ATP-binding protein [Bradyrhizobium sp. STM 3843]CCE08085.1 Periplasmic sensor signal transduction histidine kinase precursor [Bradyrhizobium sp. STM 3843]